VWSEVGLGTSFKVYLPRVEAAPSPKVEEVPAGHPQGGETILVVEDQDSVRAFTTAALKLYGYRVIEASDAEQAFALATQNPTGIQLLLTDVVLPGMNGRQLAERLNGVCPQMKVLFVSGYTADVIARRGVLDHGISYIPKPFSAEGLAAKVREVLASGQR
jgi:DNA-binding response OmpR family regulator